MLYRDDVSLIVKLISGLKLLAHSCPGMVMFFSNTPMGIEHEMKEMREASTNNSKTFFKENFFYKNRFNEGACESYNTFNTCSLAFSNSSFIRTTYFWMVES